jgi:hypothetical protein
MSLREELESIYQRRGKLTPALVVAEARNPNHPLHSRFLWNDSLAAEAYRLGQAQTLIRSVRIRYVSSAEDAMSQPVRAFTSVKNEEGVHVYEPTLAVVADPLRAQMVLNDMRREWRAMRARYENYREFWELVSRDLPEVVAPPAETKE